MSDYTNAGTVVTGTSGYVNAYTGAAVEANPATNTMSPTMKTFYDTELLENARPLLCYAQLGKKQPLPKGHGRTVEWHKFNTFDRAEEPLTEGVIPTGRQFGMTSVSVGVEQYGDYTTVSDVLDLHAADPVILGAAEEMGAAAGSTYDTLVRNALMRGTNVMYAPALSGDTETPVTSRGAVTTASRLTPDTVNRAVTWLKKLKAPRFDGDAYVAVIHPSVAYDLRSSEGWLEAHKYAAATEIFSGEIGKLHGCRFIESTEAPVLRGENLASDSRTLTVNKDGGYSAATGVAFDGGTVAEGALVGRTVLINGTKSKVTANTANALTLETAVTCADNAVIYPGEGGAEGCAVYATMFFGKDAFGIVDPEGMGLEMLIKSRGEVGGPLEQFSTVGYKFELAAAILYQERLLRVESGSSYGDTDTAN